MSTSDAPHVQAAFINAIADEGTKAEAIEWLQKTWNELCQVRDALAVAERKRDEAKRERDYYWKVMCDRTDALAASRAALEGK